MPDDKGYFRRDRAGTLEVQGPAGSRTAGVRINDIEFPDYH
jgi:hypothetical protein